MDHSLKKKEIESVPLWKGFLSISILLGMFAVACPARGAEGIDALPHHAGPGREGPNRPPRPIAERRPLLDYFEAIPGGEPIKSSRVEIGVYPILSLTLLANGSELGIFARVATFVDKKKDLSPYGAFTQYDKTKHVPIGKRRRYVRVYDKDGKRIPVGEAATQFLGGKRFARVSLVREARSPMDVWDVLVLEEVSEKAASSSPDYKAASQAGPRVATAMLDYDLPRGAYFRERSRYDKNEKWCYRYPSGNLAISQEGVNECDRNAKQLSSFAWYQKAVRDSCSTDIDQYCHVRRCGYTCVTGG